MAPSDKPLLNSFLIKLLYASQIYVSHTFGLRLVTFRQSFHNIFEKSIRSYTFRATPSQFQEHIRLYYVLSTFLYVSITFGSRFAHYSSHSYVSYTFYTRLYTFHRGFRTCNRSAKQPLLRLYTFHRVFAEAGVFGTRPYIYIYICIPYMFLKLPEYIPFP